VVEQNGHCVHSGFAACVFNPAAGDHDDESSRVTAEADDKGVGVGDVSSDRAAEGDRAYVSPTLDAACRIVESHRAERRSQGSDNVQSC